MTFENTLIKVVLIAIFVGLGIRWGIIGVTLGWIAAQILGFLIAIVRASRATELQVTGFLTPLLRSCVPAGIMLASVELARYAVLSHAPDAVSSLRWSLLAQSPTSD